MSRQRQAQLTTLAVVAGVFFALLLRQSGWRLPRPARNARELSPEDTIYEMLDAARRGDVRRYFEVHTGRMEQALRAAVAEKGEAGFAAYLRELHAPIKGVAVNEPQFLGPAEVRLRVEFVYQDRNEAQNMYLEKTGRGWKIARVDAAERVPTPIPYGTPVE